MLTPVTVNFDPLSNSRTAPEPRYSFLSQVTTPFVPVVSTVNFPFATTCAPTPASPFPGLPILIPAELTPLAFTVIEVSPSNVAFASVPDT